jgi:two-component system, OmpR family, KDP operon response regulator KdpE
MHAMLVCDEPEETVLLRFLLQRAGLTVTHAPLLESGIRLLSQRPLDLVILAVRPGTPRAQVLRVRRESDVFLAVIASTSEEDELCHALEAGADLVAARPYSARLLGLELRALMRRRRATPLGILPCLQAGLLSLDPSTRMVQVGSRPPRRLTQLEFRLLHTLMLYRGQTVPTETIVEQVWGFEGAGGMELVRGLVRRLRAKVEEEPRRPQYVITEPGVGYRLDARDE